jgi:endonuclease/exonuclease/phosphatase family metal-dependent hydrolase
MYSPGILRALPEIDPIEPLLGEQILHHRLASHYPALRRFRTHRALVRSPLWQQIGPEVERITAGIEVAHHRAARARSRAGLRIAAWNVQRGTRLDDITHVLAGIDADVVLLAEVDSGMGRSGDRNVARAIAAALEMSYAFAVSYLVLEDDLGENPDQRANSLALAGTAILSRVPLRAARNVDLPALRDKFSSSEKRLGHKRALAAELELDGGHLAVGACHLDSTASPAGRARQLAALLDALPAGPALIGGDFNSSTWDVSSSLAVLRDLAHKVFVTGFARAVDDFMTPERFYERAPFAELARRGFAIDGFNDRARGTYEFRMDDAYTIEKTRAQVGGLLTRWLQRRLRPWNGVVRSRLDWFAGRDLGARTAGVVDPRGASDHAPIVVELEA